MKTQRGIGAIGHMVLSARKGFSKLYAKMGEFVLRKIGNPSVPNPEYHEESDVGTVPKFIYAEWQNTAYAEFQQLQREWQLDVLNAIHSSSCWGGKLLMYILFITRIQRG